MYRPEDTRTEKDLIKLAWSCQDACNLSGVLFSFNAAMQRLCDLQRDPATPQGTEFKNQHLMTKLFVSKLHSLCGDLPIELPAYLFED